MDERLMESVKNGTTRRGKRELIKHLEGKKLGWGQAIKAKCYDCNGMGESDECDDEGCSLLPFSPYRLARRTPLSVERAQKIRASRKAVSDGV